MGENVYYRLGGKTPRNIDRIPQIPKALTSSINLVEKKMAYKVHRDDMDGSFEPESVADSLSLVMVKEEGKVYREKAKEMMALFGDRDVQDKCVDDLVHFFQNSSK
nr:UDP-glycosyltransferase 91A1-like [Tanacetum cinerariifolium]